VIDLEEVIDKIKLLAWRWGWVGTRSRFVYFMSGVGTPDWFWGVGNIALGVLEVRWGVTAGGVCPSYSVVLLFCLVFLSFYWCLGALSGVFVPLFGCSQVLFFGTWGWFIVFIL
jgi:hypothetical protein